MEFAIRDIIAILTILGTLIAFHIKAFYNFFMSSVKIKYKEVPGKQSMFSIVIEWLGYIGFFIYIIVLSTFFVKNFYEEYSLMSIKDITSEYFIVSILFVIVIIVTSLVAISTVKTFKYLNKAFRSKLEGELVRLEDDVTSRNTKNIYVLSILIVIFLAIIIYGISQGLEITNNKNILFSNIDKIEIFLIALIMVILTSTLLILSINMKEIIKSIKSKTLYLILIDDEEIYCSCYLEYKNHYLVIKKDKQIERYISKSKVKEIRKIRST